MALIKKICYLGTILIIYSLICHTIYDKNITTKEPKNIKKISTESVEKTDLIGYLEIEKINLKQPLYKINSDKNNIEENVTILKESIPPNKENSIIFLAAHSGSGKIAFFNNLNKLNIKDKIKLSYKNITYQYIITDIWEEKKNGYIHVNKSEKKQLVLTTCSTENNNKQLIINSKLIT